MSTPSKQHLYLIGPRGCGKTTVGQLLAKRLNWDWIDLDQVIQEQAGRSIAEIFAQQGQTAFRDMESEMLQRQSTGPQKVFSLGGGAVLRPENQSLVQTTGHVIFLYASIPALVHRVAADPASAGQRPTLVSSTSGPANNIEGQHIEKQDSPSPSAKGLSEIEKQTDEMQQILALRMPVYQQASDLQLDTTELKPQEIVDQICRWLPRVDSRFSDQPNQENS